MPDYSKGKIYKILNNIDDEIYIGSTIKTLSQRMACHRGHVKSRQHLPLYKSMVELGVEHFYIELIENCPCNDVYELRAREGHFIREIGTLNKLIAGRTQKQYKEDNYDKIKQYMEDNKEHRNELSKKHYETNKEKYHQWYLKYYEEHKEQYKEYDKQYRENNKEHIKENKKQYYENNKEHIQQHRHENITCNICGCQVIRQGMARHQKTNKCIGNKEYIEGRISCNICGFEVCKRHLLRHQQSQKCKLIAESKNKQILS